MSRAATPFVSLEPEAGTRTVTAALVQDTTASGGSAVQFANPTTPPSTGGTYGPGIGYDTKSNINIGPDGQKAAIRFKASTTSALNSVRWVQRGGPVYSNGNGGTTTLSVQADDGSGHPSGTSLGSGSITTGNPGGNWETYNPVSMSPTPTLTAGKIYYIVFTNPSTTNNISLNLVYLYNHTIPRQPHFPDSEYGVIITTGSWGSLDPGHLPPLDLAYANGVHDGQSYYAAMIDKYATISGPSGMAREQFTVSGGSRTVKSASVRVRRSGGSSPLTLSLVNSAGAVIESVNIPAASVPVSSPGGDNGGAVWVTGAFASSHVLTNGASYSLRVSTASGTTYTTHPILAGTDKGFGSYVFSDGTGQFTTNGSSWADMYPYSHQDMQFYFSL